MTDELKNIDPFPPKAKWEAQWVEWDEEHLRRKERFKDFIRPPKLPDTARFLGKKLRRAREAMGISIDQVAQGTFIKARFLDAIEMGNFEVLPGGLYTRRFIESYARFLKFDLNAVSTALLSGNATAEVLKDSFSGIRSYSPEKATVESTAETKLPRLGELLLYYFLSAEEREAFIGDVEQVYVAIEAKFGIRAAKIFFYKEILDSMSPLLARFIARIIVGILEEMKY
jgi:transcriptional regulator with XRE-family HTH domain